MPSECRADCLVHHVVDVRGTHNPLVVGGNVHIQLIQVDILLKIGTDEIVKRVPSDGQHRLPITFRIVEAVKKVNASWA